MPWRTNNHINPGHSIWICPSNSRRSNSNELFHYCLNENVNGTGTGNQIRLVSIPHPSVTVWLFDNGGMPQWRNGTTFIPICTTTARSLLFSTVTSRGSKIRNIGISKPTKASPTIRNWFGVPETRFTERDRHGRIATRRKYWFGKCNSPRLPSDWWPAASTSSDSTRLRCCTTRLLCDSQVKRNDLSSSSRRKASGTAR